MSRCVWGNFCCFCLEGTINHLVRENEMRSISSKEVGLDLGCEAEG